MATQLNDWLTIDKTSGTGNAEITLTASSYEELVERTTSLKIQGISANAILNVKQNALVPKIEVKGDLVFSSYGGERTIRIKSNIGWRFESGDWYNFNKTQGSANVSTYITVTVDSNGGDERSAVIPIYKKDDDTIIGYITLIQNNANLTVEVPTDVENCFYIEPTVTDGRVIDIQFNFTGSFSLDNYCGAAYIYYYEDSTWKEFRPATAWNKLHILKIQKRVYFKEFYRRHTSQGWQLNFNMSGEVNVGGDLSVLLGDVDNPYGYNTHSDKYGSYLFYGSPIVNASQLVLPTKMYYSAYSHMFSGCKKLIAAPVLSATTLGADCYEYMFSGCTSLVTPPELPATTLAERCYHRMFSGCTSLATAPTLPAVILKNGCYNCMFRGCSNLAHIEMLGVVIGEESLYNWVDGVSESGSFIKAKNANIPIDSNDGIPSGWNVTESGDIPTTTEQLKSFYLWVEFEDTIGNIGSFFDKGIVYSFNGVEWYEGYDNYWSTSTGDNKMVYFANTKDSLHTNTKFRYFSSKAKVGGKINIITTDCNSLFINNTNLTDASELILPWDVLAENCYTSMFRGCTSLVNAPELPATVLANNCYSYMFMDCTSLATAPTLPATVLAENCYGNMFSGCTSLTTTPALPATKMYNGCYSAMFYGCTSLVNAPELPATTLAENCYSNMFRNCTSLTTAPVLPVTTLAPGCYSYMFGGCTSLKTAPALPATVLVKSCYEFMFYGCTSLATAPTLPATVLTDSCYNFMFSGCSKLNYIKMLATHIYISATNCLFDWVVGVSETGTFVKHPNATLPTGTNGIPNGWTRETATE